ncbi:MAG: hypothetical protein HYS34_07390 [Acidobacteria bacterium]|nr:hypothetical protein [Acidobacteriota bacterium]
MSPKVIEGKVRAYLNESAALETFWNTPVTSDMLLKEWQRMARETKLPERLTELSAALGDDPFLFQETVARAALVDRLARGFFAHDDSIHAEARREITALRARVLSGEIHPSSAGPYLKVVEIVRGREEDGPGEEDDQARPAADAAVRVSLPPRRFDEVRALLPGRVGDIGPIKEDATALAFSSILHEDAERLRLATYTVPKRSFEDWFRSVQGRLDARSVKAVARNDVTRPNPAAGSKTAWSPASGAVAESELGAMLQSASCAEDTWDSGSLAAVPDGREFVTAVWTGTVMIVWGGTNYTDAAQFNSGGRYDPATDTWTATALVDAPSPRYRHTAVWTGSVMVVWGGMGPGDAFMETGGRYDPAADTWTATSLTGAPIGRIGHTAVWDGGGMIVWGGATGVETNTGGRYDPMSDTWSGLSTMGAPEARRLHTAVWTGSRMIVWGGEIVVYLPGGGFTFQYFNTGGSYNPSNDSWGPISIDGAPSGRSMHSSVWTGSLVLVWGGFGGAGVDPAGGLYDPRRDTWTGMSAVNDPAGPVKSTAVWTGSLLIVWGGGPLGGGSINTGGRYDQTTDTWTPMSTTSTPLRREGHAAVWTGTRMVVWGGRTGEVSQNTGGRYDPVSDTWTPTSLGSAPPPRAGHPAVWTGSRMIVWGGVAPNAVNVPNPIDTGGVYDPALDQWTPTGATGAPSPRQDQTAVWTGDRMIVWGGYGSTFLNSGGRYDPLTDIWTPTSLTGAPEARTRHRAVWTGKRMIVWGGGTPTAGATNTGGRYDPMTDTWTPTSLVAAPSARLDHVAVWTGGRMIVWGGRVSFVPSSGGQYDPIGDTWKATTLTGAPAGREGATAVWTGRLMIVWGGFVSNTYLDTGGRYDPAADTWSATSGVDAPRRRWGHSAVWTGSRMVIWGGAADGPIYHNSGGRYDPGNDTWDPTTDVGAPLGRSRHSGVWTAGQMLVWSGADRFTYLGSGGRYCDCAGVTATYYQDADGDGVGDSSVSLPACVAPSGYVTTGSDCSDADPGSWSPPSEVSGLLLPDETILAWSEPATTGATIVLYDVVRSGDPRDFLGIAECVAADIPETSTPDPGQPVTGRAFYYLVRAENGCPDGQSALGTRSDGTSIPGRACP